MLFRFLFCCLLLLSVPVAAQVTTGSTTAPAAVAEIQDDAIRESIDGILTELEGYGGVDVTVRSGIVTLTGEVLDASRLTRLEMLVQGHRWCDRGGIPGCRKHRCHRAAEPGNRAVARPVWSVASHTFRLLQWRCWRVLLWFSAGFLLARMRQPWDRLAPNAFIADIYRQIVRLVFIVAGAVVLLDILNATALLGTILGAAGLVGLAIGFCRQGYG